MNTSWINLYRLSKERQMMIWRIKISDWSILIQYGVLGGALQTQTEDVLDGKAGRTRREQLLSRVKSRINKQLDKGYKKTTEEAQQNYGIDAGGNIKPMLAQPYKRVSHIDWKNSYVQLKYDGHRMLARRTETGVQCWSRLGKPIRVPHVQQELMRLPVGVTVDGELYAHGVPLQTISSWIKREQPETARLIYVIFDVVDTKDFASRFMGLRDDLRFYTPVIMAPTSYIPQAKEYGWRLANELSRARRDGYEGLIIRHGNAPYEVGARSQSLVKVKEFLDGEFKCIDIYASKDGWAVLRLETDEGKPFSASAPGNMDQKKDVLHNAERYIGRHVTLEYSQLTKDGIPFHPVAVRWRNDI